MCDQNTVVELNVPSLPSCLFRDVAKSLLLLSSNSTLFILALLTIPWTCGALRFEDLNTNGTARLLKEVEDATGVKAQCEATLGKARRLAPKSITKHRVLPDDFIRWMNRYVDWDIEGRIGYTKRG